MRPTLVLYAIFISPLFDIEDLSAFADDNFTISAHIDLQIAKTNLEISLTNISKWMKDSGLKRILTSHTGIKHVCHSFA